MKGDAEQQRLDDDAAGTARWKWWGPYVSGRQWGTVREDYSATGEAWKYLTFDDARSRTYRWGEDGLAAVCDRWQHLCLGLALWNGNDPFLKERLFGLDNDEGNHGEDVKEYWWPLDGTPTHSWMQWLYRYPHAAFPYDELRAENRSRGRDEPEYELVDTGVFDDNRFFDVLVTYAKADPDDLCMRVEVTNHGPDAAPIHVLPTLWFRNTWVWGRDPRHPGMAVGENPPGAPVHIHATHGLLGDRYLACEGQPALLFCDNESNAMRLWNVAGAAYPKDGIGDHVVSGGKAATVNPAGTGTKAAAWYQLVLAPGETWSIALRLSPNAPTAATLGAEFDAVLAARRQEADEFYRELADGMTDEERRVQRLALAGLLWSKKHYRYAVQEWLEGDPAMPPPPPGHAQTRNVHWTHLDNADLMSLPDEWEYPWYAAWDLAFHTVPLASVDPEFAKSQLLILCREWFMHPNGQLPAYEWAFDDANPPVHAWAALRVFKIAAAQEGTYDYAFLERVFLKLLMNFSWWVNRQDLAGNNVFEGGFLGLDNIGLFDRSKPLPGGTLLEQSDGTSWMAMYCLNMLAIAMELAMHDRTYEDLCTKFFEHFLAIATAASYRAGLSLWDDDDGFFYDVLVAGDGTRIPLKVRSWVGLIPLFAAATREDRVLTALPSFAARMDWLLRHHPEDAANMHAVDVPGVGRRTLVALVGPERLRRILARMLDEDEFLAPNGLRSVSKVHEAHPVTLELDGEFHEVRYTPGDSDTALFGGNSNWRGPIWFPLNYLMIEALRTYHHYLGDTFTVEMPTRSGHMCTLAQVADELSRRLTRLFLPGADGRRPVNGGRDVFDFDPLWRDHVTFSEFFHGDTGAGLGASHQTGWTALVASLIRQAAVATRPPGEDLR